MFINSLCHNWQFASIFQSNNVIEMENLLQLRAPWLDDSVAQLLHTPTEGSIYAFATFSCTNIMHYYSFITFIYQYVWNIIIYYHLLCVFVIIINIYLVITVIINLNVVYALVVWNHSLPAWDPCMYTFPNTFLFYFINSFITNPTILSIYLFY